MGVTGKLTHHRFNAALLNLPRTQGRRHPTDLGRFTVIRPAILPSRMHSPVGPIGQIGHCRVLKLFDNVPLRTR